MNRNTVIFNLSDLKGAVAGLSKALPKKSIVPACEHIHFECEDGMAILTATDTRTMIRVDLPCQGDASFTISGDIYIKLLGLSEDKGSVVISDSDSEWGSKVSIGKDSFFLDGYDPSVFPIMDTDTDAEGVDVSLEEIQFAIQHTSAGRTNNDVIVARYTYSFVGKDGVLKVYTYNGFCCCSYAMESDFEGSFMLLPGAASVILAMSGKVARMFLSEKTFTLTGESESMSTIIPTENILDYGLAFSLVTEESTVCSMMVEQAVLKNTMARCLIVSEVDFSAVDFYVSMGRVSVEANGEAIGAYKGELVCYDFIGDDLEAGFNTKILLQIISKMDGTLRLSFYQIGTTYGLQIESMINPSPAHLITGMKTTGATKVVKEERRVEGKGFKREEYYASVKNKSEPERDMGAVNRLTRSKSFF